MRLAIISDIHGNLPALEAVLDDIARQQVDAVYCLGDLVGYAPFPNEVTERIRRERIPTVMGNYDDGVGFDRDECGCAYREADERMRGEQSLAWTKARTTSDNKAFLRGLPSEIRVEAHRTRVLLVHGSPRKMNDTSSKIGLTPASGGSRLRRMPTSSYSATRTGRTRNGSTQCGS